MIPSQQITGKSSQRVSKIAMKKLLKNLSFDFKPFSRKKLGCNPDWKVVVANYVCMYVHLDLWLMY